MAIWNDIEKLLQKIKSKKKYNDVDINKLFNLIKYTKFILPDTDFEHELFLIKEKISASKKSFSFDIQKWLQKRVLVPAFAAIVFIAALILLVGDRFSTVAPEHVVCDLSIGRATIIRDNGRLELSKGSVVLPGDIVETGTDAVLNLNYNKHVRIKLKEKSKLLILSLKSENTTGMSFDVNLYRGKILLDFDKLSKDDSAYIRTPYSIASVKGTAFSVSVDNNKNVSYHVLEGKVRVWSRLAINYHSSDEEFFTELADIFEANSIEVTSGKVCKINSKDIIELGNEILKSGIADSNEASRTLNKKSAVKMQHDILISSMHTASDAPMLELSEFKAGAPDKQEAIKSASDSKHTDKAAANYTKDSKAEEKGKDFDINSWASSTGLQYINFVHGKNIILVINEMSDIKAVSGNTKKMLWDFSSKSVFISSPVTDKNKMYVATVDEKIISLSLDSGQKLWSRDINGKLQSGTNIILKKGSLFFGTTKGYVYRYKPDGSLVWQMKLGLGYSILTTPVVSENYLFTVSGDGYLYGIDIQSKTVAYKLKVGHVINSSVMVSDKKLYVLNFNGDIICYNYHNNDVEWRYKTGSMVPVNSVIYGDNMYITYINGYLYKVNIKGSLTWKINVGNKISKNPVVDGKNIYLVAEKVIYILDINDGSVKWSYVVPSEITTNIALSGNKMYLGSSERGLMVFKKQ